MSTPKRIAMTLTAAAFYAVAVAVAVAAFVIETDPILKNLTFALGVFVFGCASALTAGVIEPE